MVHLNVGPGQEQVAPLRVNWEGGETLPVLSATKPSSTLWPGWSVEFQAGARTVICEPLWLHSPFQPLEMFTPEKLNCRVQLLMGEDPVLETVIAPCIP